jgi:hypothetical protein
MLSLDSSYSYDKLSLKSYLNEIIIYRTPFELQSKTVLFEIESIDSSFIDSVAIDLESCKRIVFGNLVDGEYYLNIYTKHGNSNYYISYYQPHSISLILKSGHFHFGNPSILDHNRKVLGSIKDNKKALDYYLQPTYYFQSDSSMIIQLARHITRFCITHDQKIQAIHDWVADNIYYDKDALNDGSYVSIDNRALSVLERRRCVCVGYSYLGISLLRAAGVPTAGMNCYALNITNDGGWDSPANVLGPANHILTVAYNGERWIIMDITWDSDNVYEQGQYKKRVGRGVSRRYFDTTLEFISNTHRLI